MRLQDVCLKHGVTFHEFNRVQALRCTRTRRLRRIRTRSNPFTFGNVPPEVNFVPGYEDKHGNKAPFFREVRTIGRTTVVMCATDEDLFRLFKSKRMYCDATFSSVSRSVTS